MLLKWAEKSNCLKGCLLVQRWRWRSVSNSPSRSWARPGIQSCSTLPFCRSRSRRLASAVERVGGTWRSSESSRTDWWIPEHIARCRFLHRKRDGWQEKMNSWLPRAGNMETAALTFKDTRVQETKSLMFGSSGTENVHFCLRYPSALEHLRRLRHTFRPASSTLRCVGWISLHSNKMYSQWPLTSTIEPQPSNQTHHHYLPDRIISTCNFYSVETRPRATLD